MESMNSFFGTESAEGDIGSDWATAVIKVSCLLIIGVVILNSVCSASNVTTGPFSGLMTTVESSINPGYTLATLMVLAIGSGSILYFLGFM
jgi:hypothetical protein